MVIYSIYSELCLILSCLTEEAALVYSGQHVHAKLSHLWMHQKEMFLSPDP